MTHDEYVQAVDAFWNHMMDDCPQCWEQNFLKDSNYCHLGRKLEAQSHGQWTEVDVRPTRPTS